MDDAPRVEGEDHEDPVLRRCAEPPQEVARAHAGVQARSREEEDQLVGHGGDAGLAQVPDERHAEPGAEHARDQPEDDRLEQEAQQYQPGLGPDGPHGADLHRPLHGRHDPWIVGKNRPWSGWPSAISL